jgi:Skp family chaperone for outer membrane proteins
MTFAQVVSVACLVSLSFAPFAHRRDTEAGHAPRAPEVGVIDVAKAFEQNPRYVKVKEELKLMKESFDEQLRNMGRKLSELEAAIGALEPDSDERRLKQLRFDLQAREAEGMERLLRERFDRETMVREIPIHEEIDVAARKVAEARGVKLVLKMSKVEAGVDNAKLSTGALRQRQGALRSRDVIYSADELDLTSDVIKWLMVPPPAVVAPAPKEKQ